MKVLIVGYGSIGQRHYNILSLLDKIKQVNVVTKQQLANIKTFKNIEDVELNRYDYFVICSETYLHNKQLKYICSKVNGKTILVEKPLYSKVEKSFTLSNNKILVAYNLRLHPVICKLKELLKDENIYYVSVVAGQYLPTWRPDVDYKESYSADIKRGGGVLRDLSHELDYSIWLFGDIEKMEFINTKISDLEINSDDIFTTIAITKNRVIINLTIDYISKTPMRRLIVHTKNNTIEADMIKNNLICHDKYGKSTVFATDKIDRNYTYTKMHKSILENNIKELCSLVDGEKIVNVIENVKFKEL